MSNSNPLRTYTNYIRNLNWQSAEFFEVDRSDEWRILSLVFKGQNLQIFFHVYFKTKKQKQKTKNKKTNKQKKNSYLETKYCRFWWICMICNYRYLFSCLTESIAVTTIVHSPSHAQSPIYMTGLKGGQLGSCPAHHHIRGAKTLLD